MAGAPSLTGVPLGTISPIDSAVVFAILGISLTLPNTQQIMWRFQPAFETISEPHGYIDRQFFWSFGWPSALAVGLATCSVFLCLWNISEFLYFQF
jgi:hypothetical protein